MKHLLLRLQRQVYVRLGSPQFFYVVVGILVLQSLWIALTARYPQAFDENFHFGLIQLHAQQWLPWFTDQPAGADIYGAVAHDPSYFYHYLFSFPYRLLAAFTDSLAIQVIGLRLINILIFVGGLFVYRKLFNELGISRRLRNVVLLFFVLTPVVPLLAGQINYDNLIFWLTGLIFLYTIRFWRSVNDNYTIDLGLILKLVIVGLLGCIVKYAFVPILIGAAMVVLVGCLKVWRHHGGSAKRLVTAGSRGAIVAYTLLLIICGGLFLERYGVNLLRYHTPVPDCGAVLTIEQCLSYSPWRRDHIYAQTYDKPSIQGIVVYPAVWLHRTVYETMFTITSRFADDGTVDYFAAPPMAIANFTAWTVITAGLIAGLLHSQRLWKLHRLRLLLVITAFYGLVLFLKNTSMYLHTGEAVAIHGRYLVPVYPLLFLVLALSIGWAFERFYKPAAKTWLLIVVLLFFLQGAGIVTWLSRSRADWYWPQSPTALQFNNWAKRVFDPVIIDKLP